MCTRKVSGDSGGHVQQAIKDPRYFESRSWNSSEDVICAGGGESRDPELTISPLPSGLCLPFVSHVCAHTSGLSLSLPVSPIAGDQLTIREDTKCVIPDDRPRDEGEGPPFICVRGGCEQVSSFAKPI